ncbi:efflux RND transporter periplasmic adaptor subunit [Mangrovicoccus algicola]|uniref:Efflux RND transporter periplasmic adaptor subunit n=1 Tax=Mangrovicoccus algicola TaxID=2771008 RepID=A0A8J7D068_9RHOB|nr:efflux RND transporter periplasmic adaptor subunit [Mangrovicoccus algicola]MBE3639028.1 efflux RND transporter periplasmic adaptor subunit [Mangrovicoccus algicola]
MCSTRIFRGLSALALALGALAQPVAAQQGEQPPSPVTVVTLEPQTVTLTSTLPGRVVASAIAEVRPQVAGIITERHFAEGSHVEQGDLLYSIDPATYEAAVKQARASVAAAEASLNATKRDEARVSELLDRRVGTQQSVDDARTAREQAEAQLLVAQAQLASAQIELDRTSIHARLSGEIGRSEVSSGALVTTGQTTALAVIRQIDTVYVDVTQSAADVLRWRRRGDATLPGVADQTVQLRLADGTVYEQTGTLTAAEPHVDEQTGVVVLRLTFDNPDMLLLPGMYVQVEMPTATVPDVFLVPQEGVSRDRRGRPMAMVVTAENVVETRELEILQDRGNSWIVETGLEAGDRVIVAGLQKATPGATVAPQEREAEAEAGAETDAEAGAPAGAAAE